MSLQQAQILNMVISNNFRIITNNKIALELVSAVTGYFAVSFASVQHRITDQTISRLSKMRFELNKVLNMVIYQIHPLTNFEIDLDLASLGTGYFAVLFASMQHRKTAQSNEGVSKMRFDQEQIVNMVISSNFHIFTNKHISRAGFLCHYLLCCFSCEYAT